MTSTKSPRTFLEELDDWVTIHLTYVVIFVVLSGISLCKLARRKVVLTPLPYGWEEHTEDGMKFFFNRVTRESTWKDPRSPSAKNPIKMMQSISLDITRALTFYITIQHVRQGLLHTDGVRILNELAL